MIVTAEHGFFFVHIPKNGGSSVRDQIQTLDDADGLFLGTKDHPELGIYDSSHVPLVWLKEHFGEWFETISSLDGYCLLRDPVERFASSTAQRFKKFKRKTATDVSEPEIHAEIDTVIKHLIGCGRFPSSKMSHFMRQSEFVVLDGTRMVRNAYRLADIDLLIEDLARRSGQALVADFHSNPSFELRYPWVQKPLMISKDIAKRLLPNSLTDRLRKLAIQHLAKPGGTGFTSVVAKSREIRAFVESYYADDFELFEATPPRARSAPA